MQKQTFKRQILIPESILHEGWGPLQMRWVNADLCWGPCGHGKGQRLAFESWDVLWAAEFIEGSLETCK